MGKSGRQSALLLEIMIAVLFFALASTVILEAYGAAREQSRYAEACEAAIAEAQNLEARLYASEDPEALLASEGYEETEGAWTLEGEQVQLSVRLEREEFGAGTLRTARIAATGAGRALLELESGKYEPERTEEAAE